MNDHSDPIDATSNTFADIGSAVLDERFPEVDLALRRGRHIDREEAELYQYLVDAELVLEELYRRFGCQLIHRADGYFYLLPTGDQLGRRHLSVGEMVVGQGLALLYLDPQAVESGGVVSWEDVVSHLASVMGADRLVGVFNPKKKRIDERVAEQTVRTRTQEALRKLATAGFIETLSEGRYRLRASLMRFAEPVRGEGSPEEELRKLVARGEVALLPGEGADEQPGLLGEDAAADEGAERSSELLGSGASPTAGVTEEPGAEGAEE